MLDGYPWPIRYDIVYVVYESGSYVCDTQKRLSTRTLLAAEGPI